MGLTVTGTETGVAGHPLSVRFNVIVWVPTDAFVGQLTVNGPGLFTPPPDTMVAPLKFHVNCAALSDVPVYVIVPFWPTHSGDVAVKVAVGIG